MAHEIDYEIKGQEMQYVEITLDPGESVVAEAGGMMMMDREITMEAIFGDGSETQQTKGLMGHLMSAGKRVLAGESLFMTLFTNRGQGRKMAAFAAPYPGKIVPFDLRQYGGRLILQKDSFLCAAKGVSIGIAFQKKVGVGLFGGEGFIMQKLEGDGLTFCHACGTIAEIELAQGQELLVDTGCLVALTSTVQYDIEMVKGIKSAFFGGEGLFFVRLTGPGHVWLQSLPFSRLADRITSTAKSPMGGKGEGSVLGGLGDLLNGDN